MGFHGIFKERESGGSDRFRFCGELFRRLRLGFGASIDAVRFLFFFFFEWINEKLRRDFLLIFFLQIMQQ